MRESSRHYSQAVRGFDLIPPEAPPRRPVPTIDRSTVTDADFVVIEAVARRPEGRYPAANQSSPAGSKAAGRMPEPVTIVRTRGIARIATTLLSLAGRAMITADKALSLLSPRAFAAFTLAAAFGVFWLSGGMGALVGDPPSTPALAAPEPLRIGSVTSRLETADGMSTLVIGGIVTNLSPSLQRVPDIAVAGLEGRKPMARIVAPGRTLEPGQSAAFSVRLNHPGGKVPQMTLSFAPETGNDPAL